MNVWIERGKSVTPQKLLGDKFFADTVATTTHKTEEGWKAHKKELKEVANFHSQILKDIKSGKRKTKNVVNFVGVKRKDQ